MIVGQARGQNAIDLLRKGGELIPCSETCFDVADGDFMVKSRQGGAKDGGGVALDEDQGGFFLC